MTGLRTEPCLYECQTAVQDRGHFSLTAKRLLPGPDFLSPRQRVYVRSFLGSRSLLLLLPHRQPLPQRSREIPPQPCLLLPFSLSLEAARPLQAVADPTSVALCAAAVPARPPLLLPTLARCWSSAAPPRPSPNLQSNGHSIVLPPTPRTLLHHLQRAHLRTSTLVARERGGYNAILYASPLIQNHEAIFPFFRAPHQRSISIPRSATRRSFLFRALHQRSPSIPRTATRRCLCSILQSVQPPSKHRLFIWGFYRTSPLSGPLFCLYSCVWCVGDKYTSHCCLIVVVGARLIPFPDSYLSS
ncbi:hypothetical protein WMY93_019560 [Mugilogobius chulae]|uniref:Uncharacterized protein n=1 Tax=Mugilogobius chulae TaxID=88201 RepID=A0AAW0NPF8_9GOBI